MLKAYSLTLKESIFAWNKYIGLRYDSNNHNLKCPVCNKSVIWVDHLEMKIIISKLLNIKDENIEFNLNFSIPDLYIPERKIVIEVQNSPLEYSKFIERTNNYSKNNIFVLWIFHHSLLKDSVSETLKKAHELYFGRIYIYKDNKIFPVHLESDGRWIEPNDFSTHEGYYKYYKKRKIHNLGKKIENFSLLKVENTFRNNNFKIARFYDKQFWKDGEIKNGRL